MPLQENLRSTVRDIPDFPKPGILFRDITPVLANPALSREIVDLLVRTYRDQRIDAVAGVESRGFLFGFPLAIALGIPFIMVRKKGKLPARTISHSYLLEYGTAEIEIQADALKPNTRVLIHDDLLATGGTAAATAELIVKIGAEPFGFSFILELESLNGRKALQKFNGKVNSMLTYS